MNEWALLIFEWVITIIVVSIWLETKKINARIKQLEAKWIMGLFEDIVLIVNWVCWLGIVSFSSFFLIGVLFDLAFRWTESVNTAFIVYIFFCPILIFGLFYLSLIAKETEIRLKEAKWMVRIFDRDLVLKKNIAFDESFEFVGDTNCGFAEGKVSKHKQKGKYVLCLYSVDDSLIEMLIIKYNFADLT